MQFVSCRTAGEVIVAGLTEDVARGSADAIEVVIALAELGLPDDFAMVVHNVMDAGLINDIADYFAEIVEDEPAFEASDSEEMIGCLDDAGGIVQDE